MLLITLNEHGFADESGYVKCHTANPITKEYEGERIEFISRHTGLPGWARLNGPQEAAKPGFCWCLTPEAPDEWVQVEDHRGNLAYEKTTGTAVEVTALGPVTPAFTLLAPTTMYDRWCDKAQAWALDKELEQRAKLEAAQTEQSARIATANQQIAIIKPAVDGGYAKPEHTQLLADWQRYRYELTLVPEQAVWPEEPQWPEKPQPAV